MTVQADRGGVQQLIEKWRAMADRIIRTADHHPDIAADRLLRCADELAALQGSGASPQPLKCFMCGQIPPPPMVSDDTSSVAICGSCASKAAQFLAGSGTTTPAPQSQLTPTTECPDGEKHILRCIRCEMPALAAERSQEDQHRKNDG